MQIHISPADGVPIYLQIVNQVKYLVSSGRLSAGEELPPIRTLAERLVVNPNTVARAYRDEAEAESWDVERAHALLVLGELDDDPAANLAAAYRAFDSCGAAPWRRRAAAGGPGAALAAGGRP